jgi:hypothetical protein
MTVVPSLPQELVSPSAFVVRILMIPPKASTSSSVRSGFHISPFVQKRGDFKFRSFFVFMRKFNCGSKLSLPAFSLTLTRLLPRKPPQRQDLTVPTENGGTPSAIDSKPKSVRIGAMFLRRLGSDPHANGALTAALQGLKFYPRMERQELKRLAPAVLQGLVGCYLLILALVRVGIDFWPTLTEFWMLAFGTMCVLASFLIVIGLIVILPGVSPIQSVCKLVGGIVLFPIVVVVLVYLPYFIPFAAIPSAQASLLVSFAIGAFGVALMARGFFQAIQNLRMRTKEDFHSSEQRPGK